MRREDGAGRPWVVGVVGVEMGNMGTTSFSHWVKASRTFSKWRRKEVWSQQLNAEVKTVVVGLHRVWRWFISLLLSPRGVDRRTVTMVQSQRESRSVVQSLSRCSPRWVFAGKQAFWAASFGRHAVSPIGYEWERIRLIVHQFSLHTRTWTNLFQTLVSRTDATPGWKFCGAASKRGIFFTVRNPPSHHGRYLDLLAALCTFEKDLFMFKTRTEFFSFRCGWSSCSSPWEY